MDNIHLIANAMGVSGVDAEMEIQLQKLNKNLDLYLSETDSDEIPPTRPAKKPRKISKQEDKVEEEPEKDAERLVYLDNEICRLQNLCRENFSVIDTLRKENTKLIEIQSELKDTTTDLAYTLAECPWWKKDEYRNTAFQILTSFTQNIQYILQLPSFINPLEQLSTYGMSEEKAMRFLQRNQHKSIRSPGSLPPPRIFLKCQKCKKYFTSQNRFRKHVKIHNDRKKVRCIECGMNFSTIPLLKEHKSTHKGSGCSSGNDATEVDENINLNNESSKATQLFQLESQAWKTDSENTEGVNIQCQSEKILAVEIEKPSL